MWFAGAAPTLADFPLLPGDSLCGPVGVAPEVRVARRTLAEADGSDVVRVNLSGADIYAAGMDLFEREFLVLVCKWKTRPVLWPSHVGSMSHGGPLPTPTSYRRFCAVRDDVVGGAGVYAGLPGAIGAGIALLRRGESLCGVVADARCQQPPRRAMCVVLGVCCGERSGAGDN